MKHVVFFSGGAVSYMTAKRVVEAHGAENVILLFSDTKQEDPTLYDFINESAEKLGCELVVLQDGRDVWEVAYDANFMFNSRIAQCTTKLKIATAKKYIKDTFKPDECVLYLGIDWTETHRLAGPRRNWAPYKVEYPMAEQEPFLNKDQIFDVIKADGLEIPLLYELKFAHNNCGGFCFKAGIGHFIHLLKTLPDRYFYHAEKERVLSERIREQRGETFTILRRTVNGTKTTLSLYELADLVIKENSDTMGKLYNSYMKRLSKVELPPITNEEKFEFGGCGCFSTDSDVPDAEVNSSKFEVLCEIPKIKK